MVLNASSSSAQSTRLAMIQAELENSLVSEIPEVLQPNRQFFNLNSERSNQIGDGRLSTEEIMRVAAARFIQSSMHTDRHPSNLEHPYRLSAPSLTAEEERYVDLASLLLASVEKLNNQQYDRACNLLNQCYKLSSSTGNPVLRIVYYFSDALQERIHRETGRLSSKRQRESGIRPQDVIKEMLNNHPVRLVTHKTLPFSQIIQFTAIQTILDSVASAERIHMIDLAINHGLQWTILMQALATRTTCPTEYLKITAVGYSESAVNSTGKSLENFAKSMGLPFYFKTVIVLDMKDLSERMFDLEEGEAIGVFSLNSMNPMIVKPDCLENLIRVLIKLKPCIMTVSDIEAKHNSPSFINRFTEALFFYSAFFDCIDEFMDRNDINRMIIEGSFLSPGIRSVIATEGSERVVRHVGLNVWRSFFERFGIVEAELNQWSLFQASLLVKQFTRKNSFNLDKNGKSLMLGWKGTPIHFVSAWKFVL